MPRSLLLSGLLFCLAATACNRPEASEAGDVVRTDSAGVRIVSSGAVDRPLTWTFEAIAPMRDSLGEPFIFEALTNRQVITDRAGRTYVLTRDPSIIRFNRQGAADRTFGRKGSGPGEMEFPVALVTQGDSLVVHDAMRETLVRFGPDLEPIPDLPLRDGLADASAISFRTGGLWVQRTQFVDGQRRVALFGDTSSTAALLSIAGEPTKPVVGCGGRIHISLGKLFAPELTWSTDRGRMLANRGPSYDLFLYDGYRLSAVVRRDLQPRAPTTADVPLLYPNGFKVQVGGAGTCEFALDDIARQVGLAEFLPLVHGVALLSDGTIWAQRSLRGEKPERLDVFGSDGAYVGTLTGFALPLALLPNGELLFARDDEATGGQHLVRYRVTR